MERFVNNEILHACFGGMYYGCYPFGFIYIYITALGFVKPTTLKALRLEVNSTLAVVEQKSHP